MNHDGHERPRSGFQFALNTLLVGIFVSAVFFGYSGFWYRRVVQEHEKSASLIQRLEAELQHEKQLHQRTKAQLIIAQSQLQDAVDVRLEKQMATRLTAESELEESAAYIARLRNDLQRLRDAAKQAERREREALRAKESAEQALRSAAGERGPNSPHTGPPTAESD